MYFQCIHKADINVWLVNIQYYAVFSRFKKEKKNIFYILTIQHDKKKVKNGKNERMRSNKKIDAIYDVML